MFSGLPYLPKLAYPTKRLTSGKYQNLTEKLGKLRKNSQICLFNLNFGRPQSLCMWHWIGVGCSSNFVFTTTVVIMLFNILVVFAL